MPADSPINIPEEVLDAYVMDRLDGERRRAIEGCAAQNPELAARLERVRLEHGSFRQALAAAASAGEGGPEDEWLARYLDGELTENEREILERALAGSPTLQARLVDLYRQGQAAMDPTEVVETVESHPAGERIEWESERQQRGDKLAPVPEEVEVLDAKSRKRRLSTGQS